MRAFKSAFADALPLEINAALCSNGTNEKLDKSVGYHLNLGDG
jgi:hypothetical protein